MFSFTPLLSFSPATCQGYAYLFHVEALIASSAGARMESWGPKCLPGYSSQGWSLSYLSGLVQGNTQEQM